MSTQESLLHLMRLANPVPDPGRPDQDELRAVQAVLEQRRVAMTTATERTRKPPASISSFRHRPAWVFAAAFVLTVTVVGVSAVVLRGDGTSTDLSAASIRLAPESWAQVSAEVTDPIVGISGIVVTGDRLVAVGWDPGDDFLQNGVAFVSTDGLTWERSGEMDEALTQGRVFLFDAAEFGGDVVAVGWSCEDGDADCTPAATSWVSPDGATWTRSVRDEDAFGDGEFEVAFLVEVVSTDTGLVAVGFVEYREFDQDGMRVGATINPAMWFSRDGLVWERSFEGDGTFLTMDDYRGGTMAVTRGPTGGLVAVGSTFGEQGEFIGAVWTSDDGRNWQRVAHDPNVFAAAGLDLMMWDVTGSDGGYVAVGGRDSAEPVVWASPDGLEWIRIELDPSQFDFDGSLAAVAPGGDGYLAVGPVMYNEADQPVTAWTSVDGASWRRVFQTEQVGYATEILGVDRGVVIAGATLRAEDFHAGIWVGPGS